MHLRKQMVMRLRQGELSVSEAARQYGVSAKTVRLWRDRAAEGPLEDLRERSRRPRRSPKETPEEARRLVLALRRERPTWGAGKILARLVAGGRRPALREDRRAHPGRA